MKYIITAILLLVSSFAFAKTISYGSSGSTLDLTPYIEYKSELKYRSNEFQDDIHHVRFGVSTGKVYAEIGPMRSDRGNGTSMEVGYKFKFANNRVTLKGKWEATNQRRNGPDFGHKLETELRVTF